MRSPQSPFTQLCLVAMLCLCAAASSFGQQPSSVAGLRVTVADANQRPVPGALCSLLRGENDMKATATATTDDQGVAVFSSVAPGAYVLRVEREGFDSYNKSSV